MQATKLKKAIERDSFNAFAQEKADAAPDEQEAWKAEQSSVSQLLSLLGRTIEAISFVLLLTDHRIGELISQ